MRKNMEKVIACFKAGQACKGDSTGSCSTDGNRIYSYAMVIAERKPGGKVAVVPRETSPSKTTTSHIDACLKAFGSASQTEPRGHWKAPARGKKTSAPDARIAGEMGLYTITPLSSAAKRWMTKNLSPDAYWLRGGVVFDDVRYARDVMAGMEASGLTFEVGGGGGANMVASMPYYAAGGGAKAHARTKRRVR